MPSLANLPGRVAGQPLTKAIYDQIEAAHDYLVVAGADLASAATIAPTNEFHKVTGAVTIDNIDHAAEVAGQQVRLWFAAALTVRHTGGGSGNIRTKTGHDRVILANEIVTFTYDGAVWREGSPTTGLAKLWDSVDAGVSLPAASITTPTLDQSFRDLVVAIQARSNGAASWVRLQANGETGSVYDVGYTEGNAGTMTGAATNGATNVIVAGCQPSTGTANFFGIGEVVLHDYANAAKQHSLVAQGAREHGAAGGARQIISSAVIRPGALAAISTLTFFADAGSLVTGSRITVYGRR